MLNWSLLTPRNIAVIGILALVAYFAFNFVTSRFGDKE